MSLRRKFLLALVSLVFFMAIIFAVISMYFMQALLGHAVNYIEQGYTQQWNRVLTTYYLDHGSWDGVEGYILKMHDSQDDKLHLLPIDNGPLLVFNQKEKVVASLRPNDIGRDTSQFPGGEKIKRSWYAIVTNGQTVGYFWVDQRLVSKGAILAKEIAHSLIQAMLIGLLVTSLLALLLGAFLTRHFTIPLRRLTEAVKQVGKGNLTHRLEVKGKDDIALLSRSFNRMAEQLERNEEVRRNMVADIAHELRTPLSVILGKLESIQDRVLPSTPETLLPIQDETIRLIRLVRDLQQLSLAEAGALPLNLVPVDLKALLAKILEQFQFELAERQIRGELEGEVTVIRGDSDRLTQVFVNLIGNALLHTPAGGGIRVELSERNSLKENQGEVAQPARRAKAIHLKRETTAAKDSAHEHGWVQVVVEDSGEGIPEKDLDHIFDRFYRVNKARERETGGTGLGLAIAREFVVAHGGEIKVESVLGKGTRFSVSFPKL